MKKYFLIITIIFGLLLSCGGQKDPNEFILLGDYTGNSKYLVLGYKDLNGNYKSDTLVLKNNKFEVSGKIMSPQEVGITDDKNDDLNSVQFFIEPKTIKISLKEDVFNDAKIENSKSQIEYEKLNHLINPIYKMMDSILQRKKELNAQKLIEIDTSKKKELENRINQIDNDREKLYDSIKHVKLKFAKEHPNSYVSPNTLYIHLHNIPLDTLKSYYNHFSTEVQNSISGQEIASHIERLSMTNAPIFETLDNNGNLLSLSSFQGKYVLLDFWAGWCKPCIALHPELSEIYNTYHSKGLEIIGISLDNDKENWKKAIDTNKLHLWHQIYSGRSRAKNTIVYQYNIYAIPAYILIDKEGNIIGRYLNAVGDDTNSSNGMSDLKDKLKELF